MADNIQSRISVYEKPRVQYWNMGGIISNIGELGFIYEFGHGVITVRRTMETPKKLPNILIWSYTSLTIYISLLGCSFLQAYGIYVNPATIFDYNNCVTNIFSTFIYFYAFITLLSFIFNTVVIQEAIEDTPLREFFRNKEGIISRFRIVVARIIIWLLTIGLSFFNISMIQDFLSFCLCFFSPAISYIIPVSLFCLIKIGDFADKMVPEEW